MALLEIYSYHLACLNLLKVDVKSYWSAANISRDGRSGEVESSQVVQGKHQKTGYVKESSSRNGETVVTSSSNDDAVVLSESER
jgi:hypothetical protein